MKGLFHDLVFGFRQLRKNPSITWAATLCIALGIGANTGRWLEKPGQRRRRYYRLTARGEQALRAQSRSWKGFVEAIDKILEVQDA